jgi:hypothetical protein
MDEPETTLTPVRPSSRDARATRAQLQRTILTSVAIAVVVLLAALWFSDTIRIPTDKPHLAGGAEPSKVDAGQPAGADRPAVDQRRPLNGLQPLRLWICGDSLAGALGPSLGRMTAATGIVQPQYDSRISTGLISGDVNWPEHATEELAKLNPEVVVFIIGANDARVFSDNQTDEYRMLTDQMMKVLIGPGREVYWVNVPVMKDQDFEENVKKVNEIQHEVAAKYSKNLTLVDAHTLFADEQGEYQSTFVDQDGDRVYLRAGDGIHLTGDGGDHLAQPIFTMLDGRWHLAEQADPLHPKKVLVTRGSTQVPGSDNGGSSSSRSSSSYSGSGSSSSGSSRGSTWSNSGNKGLASPSTSVVTTASTSPPATSATTAPPDPPPSSTPPVSTPGG